jgi:hypothetical protein
MRHWLLSIASPATPTAAVLKDAGGNLLFLRGGVELVLDVARRRGVRGADYKEAGRRRSWQLVLGGELLECTLGEEGRTRRTGGNVDQGIDEDHHVIHGDEFMVAGRRCFLPKGRVEDFTTIGGEACRCFHWRSVLLTSEKFDDDEHTSKVRRVQMVVRWNSAQM